MAKIKLSIEKVIQIRTLCEYTNLLDREIAIIFGVSRKHINSIRNNKRWIQD